MRGTSVVKGLSELANFYFPRNHQKTYGLATIPKGSSIKYVRKIFRKTNIFNPLIRTRTCAYQEIRNVSFSENFAYVLNGWLLCVFLCVFPLIRIRGSKLPVARDKLVFFEDQVKEINELPLLLSLCILYFKIFDCQMTR